MFYSTTGEAPGINRLEISLEDALLVCDKGKLNVCELGFHEPDYRRTATEQFAKFYGTWKDVECSGEDLKYVGILQNFVNAVQGKEPLLIEGNEGGKSLMIANAMYLSSWRKQMISLPQTETEEIEFEAQFAQEMEKKLRFSKRMSESVDKSRGFDIK